MMIRRDDVPFSRSCMVIGTQLLSSGLGDSYIPYQTVNNRIKANVYLMKSAEWQGIAWAAQLRNMHHTT